MFYSRGPAAANDSSQRYMLHYIQVAVNSCNASDCRANNIEELSVDRSIGGCQLGPKSSHPLMNCSQVLVRYRVGIKISIEIRAGLELGKEFHLESRLRVRCALR